jgi:hypothetical protein
VNFTSQLMSCRFLLKGLQIQTEEYNELVKLTSRKLEQAERGIYAGF